MPSFGTSNGNRGGFNVCAVKNNLGILVCLAVVFIPKRTRFELPYPQHENGYLRKIKVCVNLRKVGHPTLRKLSTASKGL